MHFFIRGIILLIGCKIFSNTIFPTKKFSISLFFSLLLVQLMGCSSLHSVNREKHLSKHFTMGEAVKSGVKIDKATEKNIYYTAKRMEEIRKFLGEPINVLSWYRDKDNNSQANGAKNSAHLQGLAIDFRTKSSAWTNYKKIINSKLSYDQIIYYKNLNMIHLGFKRDRSEERKMKSTQ